MLKSLTEKEVNTILSKYKNLRLYDDEKDIKRFGELVANEWNMGWVQANCTKEFSTRAYAQLCATESQYIIAYVDSKDVMQGVISFKCDDLWEGNKELIVKKEDRERKLNSMYASKEAGIPNILRNHQLEESYILEIQKACSDCELEILLLEPEFRGTGASVEMFSALIDMFKKLKEINKTTKFDSISIFTASFCTYQFYEKIGCRRVACIEKFDDEDKGELDFVYLLEDFSYFDEG